MKKEKTKKWYKRKEFWGSVITAASGVLVLFDPHTLAFKIGMGLGAIFGAFGLRKGYEANNLPSGITKGLDKLPNKITGVKGSAL